MFLVLSDLDPTVVFALSQVFGNYEGVSVRAADILTSKVDALVSPANSFGFMDGGVDRAYRNVFGLGIQRRVQQVIEQRYQGELPVGSAFIVPTDHRTITRLIVAPTMKTPRGIVGTDNVYRAMKAALLCGQAASPPVERLGVPGMGTGIGHMDPFDSAEQMLKAFLEVVNPSRRSD